MMLCSTSNQKSLLSMHDNTHLRYDIMRQDHDDDEEMMVTDGLEVEPLRGALLLPVQHVLFGLLEVLVGYLKNE